MLPSTLLALCAPLAALSAAVPARDTRSEDGIVDKPTFGGPHGSSFNDLRFVNAANGHRRISKVQLGPCESGKFVTYMRIEYKDFHQPTKPVTFVEHGKLGWSDSSQLELDVGQYITKIQLGVVKVDTRWSWKTRIGLIKFERNDGIVLGCGAYQPGKDMVEWTADADMAFLYFSGADGDAIDNLAGHFLKRSKY